MGGLGVGVEVEPVLAARHVGGVVALHRHVVEDGKLGTGVLAAVNPIEADIELLAVPGVGEERVDDGDAVQLQGRVGGAREAVGGCGLFPLLLWTENWLQ